jgi:hypothetical protein
LLAALLWSSLCFSSVLSSFGSISRFLLLASFSFVSIWIGKVKAENLEKIEKNLKIKKPKKLKGSE